jgi:hypothetical protein
MSKISKFKNLSGKLTSWNGTLVKFLKRQIYPIIESVLSNVGHWGKI